MNGGILVATFAALLLAACAAEASNVTSACGVTQNIPYIVQPNSYTCGPTSLAMSMQHLGRKETPMEICKYLGSCERGVGESELLTAAHHYGFSGAKVYSGHTFLEEAMNKGLGSIVHIEVKAGHYPINYETGKCPYSSYSGGHYIECHGLGCDSSGNRLYYICNDPGHDGLKNIKYTKDSMTSAWGAMSYHFVSLHAL